MDEIICERIEIDLSAFIDVLPCENVELKDRDVIVVRQIDGVL